MNTNVRIKDLEIPCSIGIHESEKKNKQPVKIMFSFSYNATTAAESDDVTFAKDYREMSDYISHLTQQRHYNLLEHLLKVLHQALSHRYKGITIKELEIKKPNAVEAADFVSVSLSD